MNPFTNAKVIGANINPDDYHNACGQRGTPEFVMTRSALMDFDICPARWLKGTPVSESAATAWGSLIDTRVLGERFDEKYCIKPDTYTDAKTGDEKKWSGNSTVCKQWLEDHRELIPISSDEHEGACEAERALKEDVKIHALLGCSQKQVMVSAEYQDEDTGLSIPVKILLDMVPHVTSPNFGKSLADLKTVRSAGQRAFARQVFDFNWHVQAAMYLDVYVAATSEDRTDWLFAIQENEPPFQTARRLLSVEYLDLGRFKYTMALRKYAACLKANVWPDYEFDNTINGWSLVQPEAWMI